MKNEEDEFEDILSAGFVEEKKELISDIAKGTSIESDLAKEFSNLILKKLILEHLNPIDFEAKHKVAENVIIEYNNGERMEILLNKNLIIKEIVQNSIKQDFQLIKNESQEYVFSKSNDQYQQVETYLRTFFEFILIKEESGNRMIDNDVVAYNESLGGEETKENIYMDTFESSSFVNYKYNKFSRIESEMALSKYQDSPIQLDYHNTINYLDDFIETTQSNDSESYTWKNNYNDTIDIEEE